MSNLAPSSAESPWSLVQWEPPRKRVTLEDVPNDQQRASKIARSDWPSSWERSDDHD